MKLKFLPVTIRTLLLIVLIIMLDPVPIAGQSWKLTPKNINVAIRDSAISINKDTLRPAYHLTPPVGCMGDPNGGIFYNGWYHIFYGLQPFAWHPGAWYWAHDRSKDLLHWEHMPTGLTPAFELGLDAIGSGSTIVTEEGKKVAFYSQSKGGSMKFWQAEFTDDDLSSWKHDLKDPVLTLDHPGLPPYDEFWRDPFVFSAEGRTFMIACADLLEEDYVPVPIFEAKNKELTDWEYKGNLLTVEKHKFRNLEVPEFRPIGDKWILMASTDAPFDRTNYFLGTFDIENLKFRVEQQGALDYSGHYYAQESILDASGDLYLMAWIPGWDRDWLPQYRNESLKNSNQLWNGCFALPRKLVLEKGQLVQKPVESLKELRTEHIVIEPTELKVNGPMTEYLIFDALQGDQLEIKVGLDLHAASFCGLNLLADEEGKAGFFIAWSGNVLNVDGVKIPLEDWKAGDDLNMHIFIDNKFVEIFINGGRYCVSRQVRVENIKGKHVALTTLGGTARMVTLEAWKLKSIN